MNNKNKQSISVFPFKTVTVWKIDCRLELSSLTTQQTVIKLNSQYLRGNFSANVCFRKTPVRNKKVLNAPIRMK